ncbi:hypothetical protein DRJ17_00200 [Candidatus Woesearchaeota archaeon]|nr:MAG: hypothetical protein DRJ17_00200 [Candidatus Woesearchaeota archaeon]
MDNRKLLKLSVIVAIITLSALLLTLFGVTKILIGELIFAIVITLCAIVMFLTLKHYRIFVILSFLFYIANLFNVILLYVYSYTYAIILLLIISIIGFFLAIASTDMLRKTRSSKKKVRDTDIKSDIKPEIYEVEDSFNDIKQVKKSSIAIKPKVKPRKKAKTDYQKSKISTTGGKKKIKTKVKKKAEKKATKIKKKVKEKKAKK